MIQFRTEKVVKFQDRVVANENFQSTDGHLIQTSIRKHRYLEIDAKSSMFSFSEIDFIDVLISAMPKTEKIILIFVAFSIP